MAAVVQVDPNQVHAAASRWQMIGADLGACSAPPVGISTNWPSAAAIAGIHGQAAAATEAFQARIGGTAATSHGAASAVQAQDTKVGADAIKDMLSSVSSMIGMFSGSLGSVNAATSMLGQLSTTAVSPASTDADGAARRGGG
jgi:hypothetical protein